MSRRSFTVASSFDGKSFNSSFKKRIRRGSECAYYMKGYRAQAAQPQLWGLFQAPACSAHRTTFSSFSRCEIGSPRRCGARKIWLPSACFWTVSKLLAANTIHSIEYGEEICRLQRKDMTREGAAIQSLHSLSLYASIETHSKRPEICLPMQNNAL